MTILRPHYPPRSLRRSPCRKFLENHIVRFPLGRCSRKTTGWNGRRSGRWLAPGRWVGINGTSTDRGEHGQENEAEAASGFRVMDSTGHCYLPPLLSVVASR